MPDHRLVNSTLTVEKGQGILARCVCGWSSAGHFTSLAASSAFQDHKERAEIDSNPPPAVD